MLANTSQRHRKNCAILRPELARQQSTDTSARQAHFTSGRQSNPIESCQRASVAAPAPMRCRTEIGVWPGLKGRVRVDQCTHFTVVESEG